MDLIFKQKWTALEKALNTLEEAVKTQEESIFHRDASVIRFLYTSELFWKTLKSYIYEQKDINCLYAKDVFRELQNMKVMSPRETEQALDMIKDRNFCAHAYQENIIKKIANNIPAYSRLMRKVFRDLQETLKTSGK